MIVVLKLGNKIKTMSSRLNQEREKKLQPIRMKHAVLEIEKLGITITHSEDTRIEFLFKGRLVTFFPYSGWHSGKTIKDGRGLQHLLDQIRD